MMDDVYLIDDSALDLSKGRFAVYDDDGDLIAQGDDLDAAVALARAKGVKVPAIVDLELAQDNTYVF